ncbi:MAG TPA: trehalose-phosphatase [Candidatus Acidoferrum sp.]|nr:trehalose-phosphatase [Candidatus Acidoferrum sp.]
MRPILSKSNFPALREFAAGRVLLAFDFDGTLAPLMPHPSSAALRPSTRKLLRALVSLYPCIVVSGRSRADVRRRLRGISFHEIMGNHGIEPWSSSRSIARAVESWIPIVRESLRDFSGLILEDKRFTLSVHYRHEPRKSQARRAIALLARSLPGATVIGGKQVVNVIPKGAPDKGLAVERARKELHLDLVIYVGDDENDETVFSRAHKGRYLTIRVGAKRTSRAGYFIRNQRQIDRLLKTLIRLRRSQS